MPQVVRGAAAAIAFTLVTGCQAPGPSRTIVESGVRSDHALRQEPHRAAVCVARNIDRDEPELTARIRESVAPALVEVQVYAERMVALARFVLSEDGSTAWIWIDPRYPGEVLTRVMTQGC